MDVALSWWAAFATAAVLVGYEVSLALAQRRRPHHMARTAPGEKPLSERAFFRAQMEQKWSCVNGCC